MMVKIFTKRNLRVSPGYRRRRIQKISILGFCFFSLNLLSFNVYSREIECLDWVTHLRVDHKLWIIKEVSLSAQNSAFKYVNTIPGYQVAYNKKADGFWEIKSSRPDEIEVANSAFGYVVQLNKDGTCKNTYAYMRKNMDYRDFNYNWQLCKNVLQIVQTKYLELVQKKQIAEPTSSEKGVIGIPESAYADVLKFLTSQQKNTMNALVKKAQEETWIERVPKKSRREIKPWKTSEIFERCRGQFDFALFGFARENQVESSLRDSVK